MSSSADPEHREEEENAIFDQKAKLYRFDKVRELWEERGAGTVKLLKHKETGKVRLLMVSRGKTEDASVQSKTQKAKRYRFRKVRDGWEERGAGTVKRLKHKETGKVLPVMDSCGKTEDASVQSKTPTSCANHLILASMTVQEHTGNEKSCIWKARVYANGQFENQHFALEFASVKNCKSFMKMFQEVAESQKLPKESQEAAETAERLGNLQVKEEKGDEKSEEKAEAETPAPSCQGGREGILLRMIRKLRGSCC